MDNSTKIICNCCGKILGDSKEVLKTDFLQVKKQWGYFSKKDGIVHEYTICENCYDKWLEGFVIPPKKKNATELL